MGRPQADPSPSHFHGQPQFKPASNPQHYEQVSEAPDILDDVLPPPYEAFYNDENHQDSSQYESSTNPLGSDEQSQQQFQPPPTFQRPPQAPPQNPQPAQPVPFPPQTPQTNASQPVSYPQQQPPQGYSQNPQPAQPVRFPSQFTHTNASQPVSYPPTNYPAQGHYPQAYPLQSEPVQFPPPPPASQATYQASQPVQFPPQVSQATNQPGQFQPQHCQMGAQTTYTDMPPSPLKPAFQTTGFASGIPVTNQYPTPQAGTEGWNTGLFDCMDDPGNALVTACFPCLTFGQIAEIIDNGHTSCGTSGMLYGLIGFFIGLPCLISCTYRTKLRSRYGLVESPAPDWVIHFFCEACALCQEYREIQHRGLDPSIGWLGNMAKNQGMQQQQQQVAMVPPMNQAMMG